MRLATGAATATMAYQAGKRSSEDEGMPYQAAPPPPQTQAPPAAPAAPADPLAELERLAKLHDSGALSDAEFATMKARLIGG